MEGTLSPSPLTFMPPIEDTWDIASEEEEYYMEGQHRKGQLEQKLKDGWEPFAVTAEPRMYMGNETSTYVYHLKKKLLSKPI